jgi:hypothetical protein
MIKAVDAQNAACNAVVQLVDQGSLNPSGSLSLLDASSTLIANFILSNPAFLPAVDGTSVSNYITDSTSVVDGTASVFNVFDRDASVVWSGTVSDFAGTGDLKLNSISIPQDSTISLTQIVYSVPDYFVNIGIQGATGVQGSTGVQGIQGVQGPFGFTGLQGSIGSIGSTGVAGVGITGIQGAQGITGPSGGVQGDTGVQGITGPSGGVQGDTGVQGDEGIQGLTGVQGIIGIQGLTGVLGNDGVQGLTGVRGPGGVAGVTGAGLQGSTGIQGQTGLQGTSSSIDFNQISRYEVVNTSGAEVWLVSSSTVFTNLLWSRAGTVLTLYRTGNSHSFGNNVIVRNTNVDYQVGSIIYVDSTSFQINTSDVGGTSGYNGAYSLGFTYAHNGLGSGGSLNAPTGDHADVQLLSMRIRTGLRSGIVYDLVVPTSAVNGAGGNDNGADCYVPDFNVRNDDLSAMPSNLAPIGATIATNVGGSYSTFEFGNLGSGTASRAIFLHF